VKISAGKSIIIATLAVAAMVTGSFFAGKHIQHTADIVSFNALHPVREKETSYTLISPLLGYSVPENIGIGGYQPLLKATESVIADAKRSGSIDSTSVYFRDLNTNHWFGIDPTRPYYPASLLKVPVMIAYFQKADKDPRILQHMLAAKSLPIAQSTEFDNPSALIPGKAYPIAKLIEAMITESDNGAMATLFSYLVSIDPHALDETYGNLGIQKPNDDSSADYQISTRAYGWFFRILYNATYISSERSEKALQLLSEATFKEGIVSSIPAGIPVAHKYGEHVISDGTVITAVQMHDCGIIYAPQHPYLLCIMTQTKSEEASKSIIQEISRVIYQDVTKK
jgi:beta-lactamase class A